MTDELKQQFTRRITNANKSELIVILCDMFDIYVSDAKTAIEEGDQACFKNNIRYARAVLSEPEILLADEPTGNLDSKSTTEIMELFKRINEEKGITFLQVTHSMETAEYGSRIIRLDSGKLVG